jgi:glycosyltransferase involved in cell wall biosynthesis
MSHKRSLFHRVLAHAAFLSHVAWRLLWTRKPDLIFSVTNPPFMAWVLRFVSLFRGFRYQYMILDMYPDGLVGLGHLRPGSLTVRLWHSLNRLAYRRAATIAVLGRDMRPRLVANYDLPPEKITYIPHWSSVECKEPLGFAEPPLAGDPNYRGAFVVQYSGNMGLWHDMDTLVRAAERLKDEPAIRWVMIGGGIRRAGAEALSRRLGLSNVAWHDFVPPEKLRASLASCHAALICLRAGLAGVAVPCKYYGILASGRPVIAQVPADSEIGLAVREEGCGVVVAPNDVEGLAAAVRRLAADPEAAAQMGRNAFRAYQTKYTLEQAAQNFRALWGLPLGGKW